MRDAAARPVVVRPFVEPTRHRGVPVAGIASGAFAASVLGLMVLTVLPELDGTVAGLLFGVAFPAAAGTAGGYVVTAYRRPHPTVLEAAREREETARLREMNDRKDSLLAAVSHELRTPLTKILGFAHTLERKGPDLSPDVRSEFTSRVIAGARKMDRLLSDLLDLDRLSRGILEPRRIRADVGELVRLTVLASDCAEQRDVSIACEHVEAFVDPPKLERIVDNLLSNALRYTPDGSPVWVFTSAVDDGVLLRVEDAGPGVPEELRRAVFRPFEQGSLAASGGLGLGLSLVEHLAALHGGRAWVEEAQSGGASFRVWLPQGCSGR